MVENQFAVFGNLDVDFKHINRCVAVHTLRHGFERVFRRGALARPMGGDEGFAGCARHKHGGRFGKIGSRSEVDALKLRKQCHGGQNQAKKVTNSGYQTHGGFLLFVLFLQSDCKRRQVRYNNLALLSPLSAADKAWRNANSVKDRQCEFKSVRGFSL
ncbi:hypothetical protein SDC9_169552 [bioreactor metagenome]|uniref:Uncharacterized protein n=1 Tax=bioreactor metagenome TaxID=1076179 RepID=A0A645G8Q7_9ZZZZ